MDIYATDGSFAVAAMGLGGWKYKWNKDRTLSFWADDTSAKNAYLRHIFIEAGYGDFIECLDEDGQVLVEGGDGHSFYVEAVKKPRLLRYKMLPDPALSKAELNKARRSVERWLCSDSPYSLGVPNGLAACIKWLDAKLKKIPAASRKNAKIDFSSRSSYGESYDNIKITYFEPETDKEVIRRVQIETERARVSRVQKQAKLKQLQAELA